MLELICVVYGLLVWLVFIKFKLLPWNIQSQVGVVAVGAAGLAVEVADSESLARIRAAAPGLTILPVNGNEIAIRLQIEHYPVLITATALEQ